jgi:hypothetical protein
MATVEQPTSPPSTSPPSTSDLVSSFIWIKEGENEVIGSIYLYQDPITNKLRSVQMDPSPTLRELKFIEYSLDAVWTVPTTAQMDSYKLEASAYDVRARGLLIDRPSLREVLLRHHLKEIKIKKEGEELGQSLIELKRDLDGKITTSTMNQLKKIHPSVTELIYVKFVEEAALIT